MLYDGTGTDDQGTATGQVPDADMSAERASARKPGDDERDQVSIGKDDTFHLLQNRRRRAVCRYLLARPHQQQFRMGDLAEEVAAWENDTTVREVDSDDRQRVYVTLIQSHLPKLSKHGAIEYDQSRGIIRTGPVLPVLEPYLADGLYDAEEQSTAMAESSDATTDSGTIGSVGSLLPR